MPLCYTSTKYLVKKYKVLWIWLQNYCHYKFYAKINVKNTSMNYTSYKTTKVVSKILKYHLNIGFRFIHFMHKFPLTSCIYTSYCVLKHSQVMRPETTIHEYCSAHTRVLVSMISGKEFYLAAVLERISKVYLVSKDPQRICLEVCLLTSYSQ